MAIHRLLLCGHRSSPHWVPGASCLRAVGFFVTRLFGLNDGESHGKVMGTALKMTKKTPGTWFMADFFLYSFLSHIFLGVHIPPGPKKRRHAPDKCPRINTHDSRWSTCVCVCTLLITCSLNIDLAGECGMIVGPHSTKLPQSWATGSDQPSVPASDDSNRLSWEPELGDFDIASG